MEVLRHFWPDDEVEFYEPRQRDLDWDEEDTDLGHILRLDEHGRFEVGGHGHAQDGDVVTPNDAGQHAQHNALDTRIELRKRKTIPASEWERLRPTIALHYIDQEMKLKDLRAFMIREYNFEATEQMYKKRFAAWGLQRYYRRQQKDDVIARLACQRSVRCPPSPILVNSKPVQLHKIYRHQRLLKKTLNSTACPIPASPCSRQLTLRPRSASPIYRQGFHIVHQPSMISNQENLLYSAQKHYDWFFSSASSDNPALSRNSVIVDILYQLHCATSLLKQNDNRAFVLLHRACDNIGSLISKVLDGVGRDFPSYIIYQLKRPVWEKYQDIKLRILDFTSQSAVQRFGKSHPVASLLTLMHQDNGFDVPAPVFTQVILDVAARHVEPSSRDSLQVHQNVADFLYDEGDIEAAKLAVKHVVVRAEQMSTQSSEIKMWSLEFLCTVAWMQWRDSEAEALANELYELSSEAASRNDPHAISIASRACRTLGSIYESQGNLELSTTQYRLAFKGIMEAKGEHSARTLRYLESLERVLVGQGDMDEVQQLWIDYAHIWEYWDSYTCE